MDIDMDIKELEAFVYVLENCSFSRAAELLHLTQPTISSHISALERKLGIKLLVRTTKEIYPSDAGKILYGYAREILRLREDAAEALQTFSREMRGTISIAASPVPSRYHLPELLRRFREKYPDIVFNIQIEDDAKVVELVSQRSVELGFCAAQVEGGKCIFHPFARDPIVLVTPNAEPYRAWCGGEYPPARLAQETFITVEKTGGAARMLRAFLGSLGVGGEDACAVVELHALPGVLQAVQEGLGVSVMEESAARADEQAGKVLIFSYPSVTLCRALQLVRHKHSILSPIAQTFAAYVAEQNKNAG